MSRSPIEMLIDKGMCCTRCSAPMGGCDCWTKITMRCPRCKRTKETHREETDPKGTAVVEALCDRCDDGGNKPEVHYYDAAGKWFDGEKFRRSHQ